MRKRQLDGVGSSGMILAQPAQRDRARARPASRSGRRRKRRVGGDGHCAAWRSGMPSPCNACPAAPIRWDVEVGSGTTVTDLGMSGMTLAQPAVVDSLSGRPVSAGPSAAPTADPGGRPDRPARQTGCGEGQDMIPPSPGAGLSPRSPARAAALPAPVAWRRRPRDGRTPVRKPQWNRMTMRKACRGMLFAAGLLLMETGTAWAQVPTISSSILTLNTCIATFSELLTNSPAKTDFTVDFDGTSVNVTDPCAQRSSTWNTSWACDIDHAALQAAETPVDPDSIGPDGQDERL